VIITIGNNKGGVGKTTITCNLAAVLGTKHKRVLVIDNDPQGNATTQLLNPKDPESANGMIHLLDPTNRKIKPQNIIHKTQYKNVDIIPNSSKTSALDLAIGHGAPDTLLAIRKHLKPYIDKNYDIVFIDNPPSIGIWPTISLAASDFAIVPVDPGSAMSMEGLYRMLSLISTVKRSINPGLRFLRLVVSRADIRTKITRTMIDDIKQTFPKHFFQTIIPVSTTVQQAEYLRKVVSIHRPSIKVSRALRKLSHEVTKTIELVEKQKSMWISPSKKEMPGELGSPGTRDVGGVGVSNTQT